MFKEEFVTSANRTSNQEIRLWLNVSISCTSIVGIRMAISVRNTDRIVKQEFRNTLIGGVYSPRLPYAIVTKQLQEYVLDFSAGFFTN